MTPFFPVRDDRELERRLRSGASAFAPAPPPALHGRILAALGEAPRASAPPRASRRAELLGNALAVAAAVLVLCGAFWLTRRRRAPVASERTVVELSRELLGAGTRVLALPARAEDNLRLEAARLLDDTAHAAEEIVRGLPAPLRSRLERM